MQDRQMTKTLLWVQPTRSDTTSLGDTLSRRGYRLIVGEHPGEIPLRDIPTPAAIVTDAAHLEAAAAMREKFATAGSRPLPLLVTSGVNDMETHLNALRNGADAFFAKPFDPAVIARRLDDLTAPESEPSPYRVMVVDDDPVHAKFAAALLEKSGMQVSIVTDSLRIMDSLRQDPPELILMDLYMPGATGVELTSIIREQQDLVAIPIIYFSAEHDQEKQLDALSSGGEAFLTKPAQPRHLIATVRNSIKRARQLHQRSVPAQASGTDPALIRQHILDLLRGLNGAPPSGQATGLLYLELDSPILLLERVALEGIDRLMSQVLSGARQLAHDDDRVARFGDFCLVFVAQRPGEGDLEELAHRLKRAIDARSFSVAGKPLRATVSIGLRLLTIGDEMNDVSLLLNSAMRASHRARADGSGLCVLGKNSPNTVPAGRTRKDLLTRISDTDNLHVLYQPIVPLKQEPIPLYQCLLRLRSADNELLGADAFLPAVENSAEILKLDRWVILRNVLSLRTMGPNARSRLRLMVSQSPSTLRDSKRIAWMRDMLQKAGVEPGCLILDFPFPEIAVNLPLAQEYLGQLRQDGIGVSINCLREPDALHRIMHQLPFDYIKITERQIRSYPQTWGDWVDQAHDLGKQVIISRIEHPELLGQLWSNEVDYIQGNFIQHPGEKLNYDFTESVLA
jgi:DNA-binding response OmpR family regulator/EAL domain-containing protein (putative c-di-GMP-specific phosphodiesterase class I)